MKRTALMLVAVVIATASTCKKQEVKAPSNDTVTVTPVSIAVDNLGGSCDLEVSATCEWGIFADDKEWIKLSPSGGGEGKTTVKVTVSENKTAGSRESALTVRYASGSVKVPVVQHYKVEAVEIKDPAFLKALLAQYDKDSDGILSTVEAEAVTTISANGFGIREMPELAGLFKDITSLDCADNSLVELDLSACLRLTHLDCTGNPDLKTIRVWTGFTPTSDFKKPDGAQYVEPEIPTPAGYRLVWQDEFNEGEFLDNSKWNHEVKNSGWVNHELQNYVNGKTPKGVRVTEIKDGALHITALKEDGKVYSGRVYGNLRQGWQYGYVEARILLPSGKGTWPAFWMMPVHFTSWPHDGEIDIMEEVGYHRDYVSSSLHADGHVHSNGTQVTKEVYCKGAEGEYHVYGMEWTADYFQFYVDGKKTLYYKNPGTGVRDWPYDAPFYVIFNLAWGGDWGGSQGVDESALPVTMKVDYVRVFQK